MVIVVIFLGPTSEYCLLNKSRQSLEDVMWDVVMESVTYLDNCWLINKMMVIPNLDNMSPSSIGSFLGLGKVKARRAFQRETHE
jgi:hypothetical protein